MRNFLVLIGLLTLTACAVPQVTNTPTEEPEEEVKMNTPDLPDLGPAPELENEIWLNTDEPLRLATNLRGKVVLLDMWTFG